MEHDFWHRCWQNNEVGFHEPQPNDLLMQYLNALKLSPDSVMFLPLCGKTLDIGWLLSQGHQVVGIELDVLAVEQLFKQLDIVPDKQVINDDLSCYKGPNITVYQGDIFKLSKEQLGSVDAVYDRAAMVALPEEMRKNTVSIC
jgi:Thiopurine S-methyltransferase (TPMT).